MMSKEKIEPIFQAINQSQPLPWLQHHIAKDSPGLVSILIPCCGQLEYTRLCVPSIFRNSGGPYEVIFIDVGSMDGTPEYLEGVAAAAPVRMETVRTPGDSRFNETCTEALRRANGDFVVWLNNDTIVTDSWLQQLVALATMTPAMGMVGPMSNCAPSAQRVTQIPYSLGRRKTMDLETNSQARKYLLEIEPVFEFALKWRDQNRGQWFETDRLGGFCLLIKREVLAKVNLLEENSEPGYFNATALSWKARQAGYKLACCRDLFIHHFGSRIVDQ